MKETATQTFPSFFPYLPQVFDFPAPSGKTNPLFAPPTESTSDLHLGGRNRWRLRFWGAHPRSYLGSRFFQTLPFTPLSSSSPPALRFSHPASNPSRSCPFSNLARPVRNSCPWRVSP